MKWMGYKLGPAKDSVVVIIYIHNSLTSVRVENATDVLSLIQLSSLLTCMSLIIAQGPRSKVKSGRADN